ncbi:auxin efflux carrier, partial [Coprinopsis marcescibilis]
TGTTTTSTADRVDHRSRYSSTDQRTTCAYPASSPLPTWKERKKEREETMLSVGALIWISFRPLLRLIICVAAGFIVTKAEIFPLAAARGTSQLILYIAIPCLLFSKIVPSFNADNIKAFGPLVLVASLYEIIGILSAWTIKQFFWVPHRFRNGILVAGGWGNVGDIPTSVIMSVTASAPFNPARDQDLSVAYISIFILVFTVSLFPMGGHRWVRQDFEGEDVGVEEVKARLRERKRRWGMRIVGVVRRGARVDADAAGDGLGAKGLGLGLAGLRKRVSVVADRWDEEKGGAHPHAHAHSLHPDDAKSGPPRLELRPSTGDTDLHMDVATLDLDDLRSRGGFELGTAGTSRLRLQASASSSTLRGLGAGVHGSRIDEEGEITSAVRSCLPSSSSSSSSSSLRNKSESKSKRTHTASSEEAKSIEIEGLPQTRAARTLEQVREFMRGLLSPPSVAIFVALLVSLVPQLKALFVFVDVGDEPLAPDGQPPLAFVQDAATFIGAASVPLGLVCLGSALARLELPRARVLPVGAICALALVRLVLMPVVGVLVTEGLVRAGLVRREDKVLRFVCIFCSCLPTATTQVYLTQVYAGNSADQMHLSAFLIPQYALMFFSMTGVVAFCLGVLF